MHDLLSNGRLIDVALAVVAIEAALLIVARRRIAPLLRPADILGQLAAGAMLLLGLRCAVTGANYLWTLAFLSASLPAHLFDLVRRARRGTPDVAPRDVQVG